MARNNLLGFNPDEDKVLSMDVSKGIPLRIFQVETKIEVDENLWKDLDEKLRGQSELDAYDALMEKFGDEIRGRSHAMIQAAFGLIEISDEAKAAAKARIDRRKKAGAPALAPMGDQRSTETRA